MAKIRYEQQRSKGRNAHTFGSPDPIVVDVVGALNAGENALVEPLREQRRIRNEEELLGFQKNVVVGLRIFTALSSAAIEVS